MSSEELIETIESFDRLDEGQGWFYKLDYLYYRYFLTTTIFLTANHEMACARERSGQLYH